MGYYVPYNEEALKKISEEERKKGNLIVLTGGSFDIFHEGHVYFLNECKNQGEKYMKSLNRNYNGSAVLFVNVKNDKRVRITKSEDRPVFKEDSRAKRVSVVDVANYSTINPLFEESPTRDLALLLKPDILIKGDKDWTFEEKKSLRKFLGYKIKFGYVKRKEGISSTEILRKIRDN